MPETSYTLEPCLFKLHYGGWLATTGPTTKLRIGVVGASEGEARAQFSAALQRWKEINEAEGEQGRSAQAKEH